MGSWSIQWKITIATGLCLLVTTAAVMGYSIHAANQSREFVYQESRAVSDEMVQSQLRATLSNQARAVKESFEEAYYRADMLASNLLSFRKTAEDTFMDSTDLREGINLVLQRALTQYTNFLGIYLVFEKDALDGQDSSFIEDAERGANETGRISVYWARDPEKGVISEAMDEEMLADNSIDDQGNAQNEWYECSRRTQTVCVMEPYEDEVDGKSLFMTSLSVPLLQDGKLLGVLGIDIALTEVAQLVKALDQELFDGQGRIIIVGSRGILAGYDEQPELAGIKIENALEPALAARISGLQSAGRVEIRLSEDGTSVEAFSPVSVGHTDKNWGVFIEVPQTAVYASANALETKLVERGKNSTLVGVLVALVIAALALLLIWLAARQLVRPLQGVARRLQDIASGEGDLTRRLDVASQDEVGELSRNFNLFMDKLQGIIGDVVTSVEQVRGTADRAARVSDHTSQGVMGQLGEVDLVATASEEMTATAHDVAENAARGAESAREADEAAAEGKHVVAQTTETIEKLAQELEQSMAVVERLAADSDNINKILGVIQGIAEQTNLLALNAAIEAARAGEQGRGFAVVADEVRSLARRTHDSTEEIQALISQLQAGTREVVEAITAGNASAGVSVKQVQQAVSSLERITQSVSIINDMNLQIASAAEQQSAVAEEINRNMASIRMASQDVSEQASESARISGELTGLADQQQALVGQFRI
ncbi:methyl-accepting chemotaxis protein [Aestuariirhabdus litorea]|nr:methyl-accepting chemotaxis protein [Aestuariirhabdus litorea]